MSLYPPIVASSMPAFAEENAKIYFTLPPYTSINLIAQVQATVRRQSSNVNVINNGNVFTLNFFQTEIDKALNRYYIEIPGNLIKNSNSSTGWLKLVVYKVQLRFLSKSKEYSEWSTVCLIKPVYEPYFYILDFETVELKVKLNDINNYYFEIPTFIGKYTPGALKVTKTDLETKMTTTTTGNVSDLILKSWRVRLLNGNYTKENLINIDNYTLADTGWNTVTAYNYTDKTKEVNFEIKLQYLLLERLFYKVYFEIRTNNDYEGSKLYNFYYYPISIDVLPGDLKTYVNEEEGYIKVSYTSEEELSGNITLRRSDSTGNFLNWEDLKTFEGKNDGTTGFDYYDFTAESGIAYRYLLQRRDTRGRRGKGLYDLIGKTLNTAGKKVLGTVAEWLHAFLLESSLNPFGALSIKQLKLKFDFQISSYKTNISESKTDTIGSKYPFIRRNGNMYYHSFPCTGTITAYMDSAELFVTKDELNDNYSNIYDDYKGTDLRPDYTYLRKFREAVEEFLYNPKPKLYKSMQEGNLLVKLMEVSLTPKNELGRLIYTFSATAYEIANPTIYNYDKYGILSVGTYNPNIVREDKNVYGHIDSYLSLSQPYSTNFYKDLDIIGTDPAFAAGQNSIAKKYAYEDVINGNRVNNISLSWLRITVESLPYLIKWNGSTFEPLFGEVMVQKEGDTILNGDVTNYDLSDPIIPEEQLYQIELGFIKDGASNVRIGWMWPLEATLRTEEENQGFVMHNESVIDYLDWIDQNVIATNYIPVYLGTLFYINGDKNRPLIIGAPPNNIYEIDGDIPALVTAKDCSLTLDFLADIDTEVGVSRNPVKIRASEKIAQIIVEPDNHDNIINTIQEKYYDNYTINSQDVNQYMLGVNSISIDCEPGTVVQIRTNVDNNPSTIIVNDSGLMEFNPQNSNIRITEFRILGIGMNMKTYEKYNPPIPSTDSALVNYFVNVRSDYYEHTTS